MGCASKQPEIFRKASINRPGRGQPRAAATHAVLPCIKYFDRLFFLGWRGTCKTVRWFRMSLSAVVGQTM